MIIRKLCLILALSLGAVTPGQAALVSLSPTAPTVSAGDTFTVDLQVSSLGAGNAVGAYDIDLGFDPGLLSLTGVFFGSGLDVLGLGSLQFSTSGVGQVNLFELSLDTAGDLIALQPGTFVLATLNFFAVAPGTSAITLSLNALGDAYGDALPASLVAGSVMIAANASVPEPATYALVALALFVIVGVQRRRKLASSRKVQHL